MSILKCKMCGGSLRYEEGISVVECDYCGSYNTLPLIGDEKRLKLFDRANRLRLSCEFDKSYGVYEAIVAEHPEEAEAYWGLVLCKYGVEYVQDPGTGRMVPTCHRTSFESVFDDANFDMVMECSDQESKTVYREEAKQIEQTRESIVAISAEAEPYDVFICYKETDEEGNRTLDSVIAQEIYESLSSKGLKAFFSRISLEDKLGQEYEPYIFAALNSAKTMIVVGTSYDNYNSVWVKNEWSRYLKLMEKDKSKHLIPCFKDIDAYDMPREFSKLQAQDMSKIGATEDLVRGVLKIIPQEANKSSGITADELKTALKQESRKRSIKSVIAFILLGAVIAVGGYFGVNALITMIQNNKQTIINENYYEKEKEAITSITSQTIAPTNTPTPTPTPQPLSIENFKFCTVWENDTEHLTCSYDVVGDSNKEYKIKVYILMDYFGGVRNAHEEYFMPVNGSNDVILTVPGGVHVYPWGQVPENAPDNSWSSGSTYFSSSSLCPGTYTFRIIEYGTDRVLAADTYQVN